MTKPEIRMKSETRFTNDALGASSFVIHSGFWFRHSDFYCTIPFVSRMNAVSRFTSSSFSIVNLNPF